MARTGDLKRAIIGYSAVLLGVTVNALIVAADATKPATDRVAAGIFLFVVVAVYLYSVLTARGRAALISDSGVPQSTRGKTFYYAIVIAILVLIVGSVIRFDLPYWSSILLVFPIATVVYFAFYRVIMRLDERWVESETSSSTPPSDERRWGQQ
ncbi:hypothetical protein ACOACO_08135 [Nocardioides sp. CPCC 205120]|uniref:hypothetical protein n=1 Tax=Nocardioides sp. CPCC 205120 TaxID=3406462 RepID=UPI003B507AC3